MMGIDRTTLKDVTIIVMLPFIALCLLIGPVWIGSRILRGDVITSCHLIDANVKQLQTLRLIALDLGLPANYRVPGVPAECDEFLP